MKIQILSDLHFECHRDGGKEFVQALDPADVDVLVLAGDITSARSLPDLETTLSRFAKKYKDVIYVAGNHEFYYASLYAGFEHLKKACAKFPNVHLLEHFTGPVVIQGQSFVGGTLWFPGIPEKLRYLINDFVRIKDVDTVPTEHAKLLQVFQDHVTADSVVVTHMAPSYKSIASRYVGELANYFFANELDAFILDRQPKLWIHGHTHSSFNYTIGKTRIICNPFGYYTENLNGFQDKLIVEV